MYNHIVCCMILDFYDTILKTEQCSIIGRFGVCVTTNIYFLKHYD